MMAACTLSQAKKELEMKEETLCVKNDILTKFQDIQKVTQMDTNTLLEHFFRNYSSIVLGSAGLCVTEAVASQFRALQKLTHLDTNCLLEEFFNLFKSDVKVKLEPADSTEMCAPVSKLSSVSRSLSTDVTSCSRSPSYSSSSPNQHSLASPFPDIQLHLFENHDSVTGNPSTATSAHPLVEASPVKLYKAEDFVNSTAQIQSKFIEMDTESSSQVVMETPDFEIRRSDDSADKSVSTDDLSGSPLGISNTAHLDDEEQAESKLSAATAEEDDEETKDEEHTQDFEVTMETDEYPLLDQPSGNDAGNNIPSNNSDDDAFDALDQLLNDISREVTPSGDSVSNEGETTLPHSDQQKTEESTPGQIYMTPKTEPSMSEAQTAETETPTTESAVTGCNESGTTDEVGSVPSEPGLGGNALGDTPTADNSDTTKGSTNTDPAQEQYTLQITERSKDFLQSTAFGGGVGTPSTLNKTTPDIGMSAVNGTASQSVAMAGISSNSVMSPPAAKGKDVTEVIDVDSYVVDPISNVQVAQVVSLANTPPRMQRYTSPRMRMNTPYSPRYYQSPRRMPVPNPAYSPSRMVSPANVRMASPTSARMRPKCPYCPFVAEKPIYLKEHLERQHLKNIQTANKFPCKMCNIEFVSRMELKAHCQLKHAQTPISNFHCHICNGKFPNQAGLIRHFNEVHQQKKFRCQVCQAEFGTQPELMKHMGEVHAVNTDQQQKFTCHICNRQYSSKNALKVHIHEKHQDEQHKCRVCGEQFSQRHTLQAHMDTHSEIKPYECSKCQRKFIYSTNKNRHEAVCTARGPSLQSPMETMTSPVQAPQPLDQL